MKKLAVAAALCLATLGLVGCSSKADTVNENLDKEADNFSVLRQVVFYNAITGTYIETIEGFCSVDPGDSQRMTVTCKVGNGYKRDALGKSDNVLWFYIQLDASKVDPNHYEVVYRPSTVVPNIVKR